MDILAWGIVPPVLLLIYVYRLDRVEKEPVRLVMKVLLLGCLSCIPAAFFEFVGEAVLESFVSSGLLYNLILNFAIVALAEEACKRMAMKLAVWKRAEFNYLFDAVLYSVAAALGFALLENIEYMVLFGTDVALQRLIPVHTICGVFMGLSLGAAKNYECMGDKKKAKREHVLSLFVPIIIHGSYDFAVGSENEILPFVALVVVCILTFFAFMRLRESARDDRPFHGMVGGSGASSNMGVNPVVPVRPIYDQPAGRQAQPVAPLVQQSEGYQSIDREYLNNESETSSS